MLPITFLPAAEKYLKKIKDKRLKSKYGEAIRLIRNDPNVGQSKTGDLYGTLCYDIRHDSVNYRMAYCLRESEKGKVVVIIMAGNRENFYDELKRYWK